jgi:hypothetical protein
MATLRDARAATLVEDWSGIQSFLPVSGFGHEDHFQSSPREVYEGVLLEQYADTVEPRPRECGAQEWQAWIARCAAWERERVPPFVWGTRPVRWDGISAAWIREAVLSGTDSDSGGPELETSVEDMIESDVTDQHHEDAMDEVVDWKGLAFVDEWLPHAGSGDAVDLAFEGKVAEWNAKQTLVSYYEDHGTVVPSRDGVDMATIDRWCEREVERRREALERYGYWRAPSFPAGSGTEDRFVPGHPHPGWRAKGM